MAKTFAPKSLRVLYKDFLDPDGPQCCSKCSRTLRTGAAIFLLGPNDHPLPFGPQCAKTTASTPLTHIPNHTKGVSFQEDVSCKNEDGKQDPKSSFDESGKNLTERENDQTKADAEKAVIYASLRCEKLPNLGFNDTILPWPPLKVFFESYKRGNVQAKDLGIVLKTIKTTQSKDSLLFLSFDNLRACYLYAWMIRKIFAECSPTKKMDYHECQSLGRINNTLRHKFFLGEEDCNTVFGLAKKYLSDAPTEIRLSFAAAKPAYAPPNPKQGFKAPSFP